MKKIFPTLTYLFACVSADALSARQESHLLPSRGVSGNGVAGSLGPEAKGEPQQSEQFLERAGRTPNETSSASFNFLSGGQWTWNVNITEVNVPQEFFNTSGLQVVNTQWDLQWPGGGSLESYMSRSGRNDTLCLSASYITLPSNVTGRYSTPGNCSDVLGSDCAASILSSFGCNATPSISVAPGLKGCEDTLVSIDTTGTYGLIYTLGSSLQNTTYSGNTTVFFDTSPSVPEENVTETYSQAESRLDILVLGDGADNQMLCQIVNPSASSGVRTVADAYGPWSISALAWMIVLLL